MSDFKAALRALQKSPAFTFVAIVTIAVGIGAGYLVAIFMLNINGTYYMANMVR